MGTGPQFCIPPQLERKHQHLSNGTSRGVVPYVRHGSANSPCLFPQKWLHKRCPHWCLSLPSGARNMPANSQMSPQLVDKSPLSQILFHSCELWLQKWWWKKQTDQYWESTTVYVRDTFSLYVSSLHEINARDQALCWVLWWHPTDHHSWPHCSPHSSELLTDLLHDSFSNLKPAGTVDLHILISIVHKKTPSLQLKAWQLQ